VPAKSKTPPKMMKHIGGTGDQTIQTNQIAMLLANTTLNDDVVSNIGNIFEISDASINKAEFAIATVNKVLYIQHKEKIQNVIQKYSKLSNAEKIEAFYKDFAGFAIEEVRTIPTLTKFKPTIDPGTGTFIDVWELDNKMTNHYLEGGPNYPKPSDLEYEVWEDEWNIRNIHDIIKDPEEITSEILAKLRYGYTSEEHLEFVKSKPGLKKLYNNNKISDIKKFVNAFDFQLKILVGL
jgi:hypothetical protein